MNVKMPDGTIIENVPENITQSELLQRYKSFSEKPASVSFGEGLRDIPRQVGLTARAGINGLTDVADLLASPIRAGINAATGLGIKPIGDSLSDAIGLPKPQNADERVVNSIVRGATGALTPVGIAGMVKPITQSAQMIKGMLTANPGLQATSGASAGGFMQSVAEAGGGPLEQAGAALLGGVAAPAALIGAGQVGRGVAGATNKALNSYGFGLKKTQTASQTNNIDVQINQMLKPAGIKFGDLSSLMQKQMRDDVKKAAINGEDVSKAILRRLAEYELAGATPSRGPVTLDPAIITQQKNAAKIGMQSTDETAQKLGRLEYENNAALLKKMNELGADNAMDFGESGLEIANKFQSFVDKKNNNIRQLYGVIKNMPGRQAELNSHFFTTSAAKMLDKNNKTVFLPAEEKTILNQIATGELPLTVDVMDNLKSIISESQRGATNGNVRAALGIVREQLEKTPLRQGADDEAIKAYNVARAEVYNFKKMQKQNPVLKKIAEGEINTDNLFNELVVKSQSKILQNSLKIIGDDGKELLRNQTIAWLKDKATGGRPDDLAKLSGANMQKAMDKLGKAKLDALFSKAEQAKLKAVSNVASYEQFQPPGSAVNNPNTASAALGVIQRLAGSSLLGKIPIAQLAQTPLQNMAVSSTAKQMLAPNPFLPRQRIGLPNYGLPQATVSPTIPGLLDDQ